MTADDRLWYVGYGSNLLSERFHTYLQGSDAHSSFGSHRPAPSKALPAQQKWLRIDHALYFAGVSKRWGGSPAFVSWQRTEATPSLGRAYLIEREQFAHVVAGENAVDAVAISDPVASLEQGQWERLPLPDVPDPHVGKYDALLRLPDIEGRTAWTVTSSSVRERGVPSPAYLATIRKGLAQSDIPIDADSYLDRAVARSASLTLPDR